MKKSIFICLILLLIIISACVNMYLTQPIRLAICGVQEPYLFTISDYKNIEVTYGGYFEYENLDFNKNYKTVRNYEFVAPHMYTETFQLTSDESKQLKKLIKSIKKSDSTRPNQLVTDVVEIGMSIGGKEFYSIYYNDISNVTPNVEEYCNKDLIDAADMLCKLSNLKSMVELYKNR